MDSILRDRLQISSSSLEQVNALLLNPDTQVINDFLAMVEKYGTVVINVGHRRHADCPGLWDA
jgi:hypothetical protein